MKNLRKFIVVALLVASPISGMAADKQESVERLLEVMKIEEQLSGSFDTTMTPIIEQLTSNLQLNKTQQEELVDIIRYWFIHDLDRKNMIVEMGSLYSQAFSQQEIESIIEFYSTPVGQKLVEKSPALMQTGAQLGIQEAERAQPKLIEKLTPFLEKHQIK